MICRKDRISVKYTLEELEKRIGYTFRDKKLLRQALTHSSFANEQKINKLEDYERLEFWGMRCWSWYPVISCSMRTPRCLKAS